MDPRISAFLSSDEVVAAAASVNGFANRAGSNILGFGQSVKAKSIAFANNTKGLYAGAKSTMSMASDAVGSAGSAIDFVAKNSSMIHKAAYGAAMAIGAYQGMMSDEPFGETYTQSMSYDKSVGLAHDNLGATGDLTLALHNRR